MNTGTNTIINQVVATFTSTSTAQGSDAGLLNATTATITQARFGIEQFIPEQYLGTFGFLNNFSIFGNTLLAYIFALVTIFIAFLVLPILWKIFAKYLYLVFEKTRPDFAPFLKEQLNKFNLKIFLIIAIYIGILTLNLPSYITLSLKSLVYVLIGIQIAVIVAPLIEPIVKMVPALNKPELKPITNRAVGLLKMLLWAVVGIFSLSSLGMDTGPILGSIGVLGIGGALAFQQMIPGFIKVLGFHFSKNFSIGDKISAGTHQGVVEEIDISTTRIRKANGDISEVKNEELMSAIVIPADGPHIISETIKINLDVKNENIVFADIENIFKKCVENIPDTKFEKIFFTNLKGTGVDIDLNYNVVIEKKIESRHAILTRLVTELKSKNIIFTGV